MSTRPTVENDAPLKMTSEEWLGALAHAWDLGFRQALVANGNIPESSDPNRYGPPTTGKHRNPYRVILPGEPDTCICDPAGPCLGAEHDTGGTIECKACLVLDPELPCLNDPEAVGGPP